MRPITFILLAVLSVSAVHAQETSQTLDRVHRMQNALDEVNTLAYTMRGTERMDGKLEEKTSFAKVSYNPSMVYVKMRPPETEREVLWIQKDHDGDALINPASFPYFNMWLDPYGSLMRGSNHHTLHDAGFVRFEAIIDHAVEKAGSRFHDFFRALPDTTWMERRCGRVLIDNFDYRIEDYTVQEGETATDLARMYNLNDYKIVELNEDVDDYDDMKAGQEIKVPSDYCRKVLIWMDLDLMVPVVIEIYDELGLFEKYEYLTLDVNPEFAEDEFSEDNEAYGF